VQRKTKLIKKTNFKEDLIKERPKKTYLYEN